MGHGWAILVQMWVVARCSIVWSLWHYSKKLHWMVVAVVVVVEIVVAMKMKTSFCGRIEVEVGVVSPLPLEQQCNQTEVA